MFDYLINQKKLSFITRANRFLNPIRAVSEASTIGEKKRFINFIIFLKIFLKLFIFFKNSLLSLSNLRNNQKKFKKCDILIISHLLKPNFVNKKDDFYFGNISNYLNKIKKKNFRLLINHSNLNSCYLNEKNKNKYQFIIPKQLDLSTEIKIFLLQLKEIFKVFFFIKGLNKSFLYSYIHSSFESETVDAIRVYFFLKKNLKYLNPKKIIFTYEGYSWEKLIIKSSKEFNKKIKCIGYQHVVINNYNFGLLRKINGEYKPDLIWSNGKISKRILSKSKNFKNKIYNIGYLKKKEEVNFKHFKKKSLKVLVIPEGIYSECKKLFEYSFECAKNNKDIKFVWRLHPVIDKKKLEKIVNFNFNNIPKNIIISNQKISLDSKKCSHVLYRGSAAVIESIIWGCQPIYLNYDKKIYFDPLVYLNYKKDVVVHSYDLKKAIIKKKSKKDLIIFEKKVKDFYNNTFGDIDYKKIRLSLKKN